MRSGHSMRSMVSVSFTISLHPSSSISFSEILYASICTMRRRRFSDFEEQSLVYTGESAYSFMMRNVGLVYGFSAPNVSSSPCANVVFPDPRFPMRQTIDPPQSVSAKRDASRLVSSEECEMKTEFFIIFR